MPDSKFLCLWKRSAVDRKHPVIQRILYSGFSSVFIFPASSLQFSQINQNKTSCARKSRFGSRIEQVQLAVFSILVGIASHSGTDWIFGLTLPIPETFAENETRTYVDLCSHFVQGGCARKLMYMYSMAAAIRSKSIWCCSGMFYDLFFRQNKWIISQREQPDLLNTALVSDFTRSSSGSRDYRYITFFSLCWNWLLFADNQCGRYIFECLCFCLYQGFPVT